MKHFFASSLLTLFLCFSAAGQYGLNVGQTAPDFTVTDINGTSHNLYSYLDQGYKVFLEMGATWCGPCWQYHESGILKTLYENHGPAGFPGVSVNTTNTIMVLFLEADPETSMVELMGGGSNSAGDWITGTPYPIVNLPDHTIQTQYQIIGFPTGWLICPDRIIEHFYFGWYFTLPNSVETILSQTVGCPYQTTGVDAGFLGYAGTQVACGQEDVVVALQNHGTQALTAATLDVLLDGVAFVSGFNWTGNLAPWESVDLNFGPYDFTGDTDVTVHITSADANANNNTMNHMVESAPAATTAWNIYLRTDCYGFDTSWEIVDEEGTAVASGGNYASDTEYNLTYFLPSTGCYTFFLYDSFGDGMYVSNLGIGDWCAVDGACHVSTALGTVYSYGMPEDVQAYAFTVESHTARVTTVVSVEDGAAVKESTLGVYPNPTSGLCRAELTLLDSGPLSLAVYNMIGERVLLRDFGVQPAGAFSTAIDLSGMASGRYFVQIIAGGAVLSKTLVVAP